MMFDSTDYRCEICGCLVYDGYTICDNCEQKMIEKPFYQCDICGCLVSDGHTICDDCDIKWWDNYKKKKQMQEKDPLLNKDDYDDNDNDHYYDDYDDDYDDDDP